MASSFSDIIQGETPTLVDIYADWCGPCKTMSPILEDLKVKMGNKAKILKVNIDKNLSLAKSYKIQGVPTLLLFQNGNLLWRQSGVIPARDLEKIIHQYTKK